MSSWGRDTAQIPFKGGKINMTWGAKDCILWFSTTDHAQADRIAKRFWNRKADFKVIRSKSRTLVKIFC